MTPMRRPSRLDVRALAQGLADRLSLRTKFTTAFVLIVIGGTVISTAIGTRIITNTLLGQARLRVHYGLEVAHTAYQERLDGVRTSLSLAASNESVTEAVRSGSPERVRQALAQSQSALTGLSFLSFVDARTGELTTPESRGSRPRPRLPEAVHHALAGQGLAWSDVMGQEEISALGSSLAAQTRVELLPRAGAPAREPIELTSSLALLAAVPVRQGGEVVGALYGGMLLNRDRNIVDRVKNLVFGGEQHGRRDIGSVSIFLGDVRVATDHSDPSDGHALGARASPDVVGAVLREGRTWYGRAFDAGEWHVAAYEPIRNGAGEIVGMLSLSMLEAPALAVATHVMLTFYGVAAVAIIVVLVLSYLIIGGIMRPLRHMVDATEKIAAGDLDLSVHVTSHDEIGHLAESFNKMLQSLRAMKTELQDWARMLEEKVRQRSDELLAVQARMAQSEKLASIGRLAAGVAHEINNPLGGILSLAMLNVEDRDEQDPIRADLEIIVKQTIRCREIVKRLLDFSRQSESRAECTHVNPLIENTLSLLERQPILQNVHTIRALKDGLPPIFIDPGRMQEVIINIVINAVDAMQESGQLTVETDVDLAAREVVIRISDTGKGIPEDILPFIFEPFFTTKKVGQGTGLGLSIVHGIITRAGGRIEVKSSTAGTTFALRLPVANEDALPEMAEGGASSFRAS